MPKRPPTAHHRRQRDRILAIAGNLVLERGFASVRLADIASAADMKAPALYSYFSSRDELLAEVLRATLDALQTDIVATDDPAAATAERLRTRCRRWSRHAEEAGAGEIILLHRAIIETDRDPTIAAVMGEAAEWTRNWFLAVLHVGRQRGEVRDDVDLVALADLINACFLGIEVGTIHGVVHTPGGALLEMFLDSVLAYITPGGSMLEPAPIEMGSR